MKVLLRFVVIIFFILFHSQISGNQKDACMWRKKRKKLSLIEFLWPYIQWINTVPWCLLSILSCRSFWRFLAGTGYSRPWRWPDESVTDDHYHPHPPTVHCLLGYVKLGKYGTNAQVHIYNDISISYILIHLTIW